MLMGLVEERQRSSNNPDQIKILNEFLPNDIIHVIPTRLLYQYRHPVEGIDFRVAELEVFLKLEVFQGFSTDILVIIWFKIS